MNELLVINHITLITLMLSDCNGPRPVIIRGGSVVLFPVSIPNDLSVLSHPAVLNVPAGTSTLSPAPKF